MARQNTVLGSAKKNKKDEFYTSRVDIEDELVHYEKYFENVFNWVEATFGKYDKTMKGVKWGVLYNQHKDDIIDAGDIQKRIPSLLADREVQKKSGIYEYLLTGDEKVLSLRAFDETDKITMYHRQGGKCAICGKPFDIKDMHGDHVKAWSKGGKTELDNGQMLCTECNLKKSNQRKDYLL